MSKPRNYKSLKIEAERLFVEEGLTCKAISEALDISEVTLSKWRKEGRWDQKREEMLASPHKIKELLIKQLKIISEGGKSEVDADALSKMHKVISGLSATVSVQIVFSVFKEFDNWMADQDPKTAVLFTEWHKQFLLYKINQES